MLTGLTHTGAFRTAYRNHPDCIVEITLPSVASGVGVTLIHGGFWRREKTIESFSDVACELSARGFAVGNIEYRSIDQGGAWPHCLKDVLDGIQLFGQQTGIPLQRTIAIGHSAGGHLLLCAAEQLPRIGMIIALAPITDLIAAHKENLGQGAAAGLIGQHTDLTQRLRCLEAASPRHRADPLYCPVVVMHGRDDQTVPVEQSIRYVQSRKESRIRLVVVDGARHMHLVKIARPAWQRVLVEILSAARVLTSSDSANAHECRV